MLANQGQACEAVSLLDSADAGDTNAATSDWIDVRKYEGDLVITVNVGVVTAGSVALAVNTASDDEGYDETPIVPTQGAFTTVTTSNDPLTQKRTIPANATLGFIQIVGTVTTGPVQIAATLHATPKYAS